MRLIRYTHYSSLTGNNLLNFQEDNSNQHNKDEVWKFVTYITITLSATHDIHWFRTPCLLLNLRINDAKIKPKYAAQHVQTV
jgi:hypothetical protein